MQTYAGVCSSLQVSAAVERRGAPKLGKKRYVSWRKKRRCEPAMRRCMQVYVALRRCLRRKKASPALRPLPKAGESLGPEASFSPFPCSRARMSLTFLPLDSSERCLLRDIYLLDIL